MKKGIKYIVGLLAMATSLVSISGCSFGKKDNSESDEIAGVYNLSALSYGEENISKTSCSDDTAKETCNSLSIKTILLGENGDALIIYNDKIDEAKTSYIKAGNVLAIKEGLSNYIYFLIDNGELLLPIENGLSAAANLNKNLDSIAYYSK